MKKIKLSLFIVFCPLLLNCQNVKQGLGLEKNVPNEFLVEKKQSIILPPDYNLVPPDSLSKENKSNNNIKDLKSIFNSELKKNDQIVEGSEDKDKTYSKSDIENKVLSNVK